MASENHEAAEECFKLYGNVCFLFVFLFCMGEYLVYKQLFVLLGVMITFQKLTNTKFCGTKSQYPLGKKAGAICLMEEVGQILWLP